MRLRGHSLVLAFLFVLPLPLPGSDQPRVSPTPGQKTGHKDLHGNPLPTGALARLGSIRLRHGATVTSLAFSVDGKRIASGGQDGTVRVWDPSTGMEVRSCRVRPANLPAGEFDVVLPIETLVFFPDGKHIAFGDFAGTVHLWNVDTGTEVRRLKQRESGAVHGLTVSPDGRTLWSAGRGIHQWLTSAGVDLRSFPGQEDVIVRLVLRPKDDRLVSVGREGSVRTWDTASGRQLQHWPGDVRRKGLQLGVGVALSADGTLLATSGPPKSTEGPVTIWDLESGREVRTLQSASGGRYSALAFSPSGKALAGACLPSGELHVWGIASGAELRRLQLPRGHVVTCLTISPDGKTVACAGTDQTVHLWDLTRERELLPSPGHRGQVQALALFLDGKTAVTWAADHILRVWETATGQELAQAHAGPNPVSALSAGADGKTFFSLSSERVMRWELADGRLRSIRRFQGEQGTFTCMALSPSGKVLAVAGSPLGLRIWDADTGQLIRPLTEDRGEGKAPAPAAAALAFSPDGKLLAAAALQAPVRLWDVPSGKLVRQFGSPRTVPRLAFSPDGKALATSDLELRLWEVATGQERLRIPPRFGAWTSVAFLPGGTLLALGGQDGTVHLYEAATGLEAGRLKGHASGIRTLACAADGRVVVSAAGDCSPDGVGCSTVAGQGPTLSRSSGAVRTGIALAGPGGHGRGQGPPGGVGTGRCARPECAPDREASAAGTGVGLQAGQVLTGGRDGSASALPRQRTQWSLRRWDLRTGQELQTWRREQVAEVRSALFAPDGSALATASQSGVLRLTRTADGKDEISWLLPTRRVAWHSGGVLKEEQHLDVSHLAFAADGGTVAAASKGTLTLWERATARKIREIPQPPESYPRCAFFPRRQIAPGG